MDAEPEYRADHDRSEATDVIEIGDRQPSRRRRQAPRIIAVAIVALLGGAGVAYASTHSVTGSVTDASTQSQASTPSASPSPSAPTWHSARGGPGRFGPFGGFGGFGIGGFGGAIHGQLTVPKPGGGYQTLDVQRGTVTAVSSSSITIKSADGYTATYAVSGSTEVNAQAAGIGTVKVGDTVSVTATVSSGGATADSIVDMTSIRGSRGFFPVPNASPAGSQN